MDYFSKINTNGDYDLYEGEVEHQDLRYYTHVLTERATEFVSQQHERAVAAQPQLHHPALAVGGPRRPGGQQGPHPPDPRRVRSGVLGHRDGGSLRVYRAMVEDLDAAVGQVLDAVDSSGQLRDTVVFFASDNGGERFSYVWPFTGAKGSVNEGGIRVPTLLSWPGTLPGGQRSHVPVVTMDWTATLLDLAGARPDPKHPLDGSSLSGYLLRRCTAPAARSLLADAGPGCTAGEVA